MTSPAVILILATVNAPYSEQLDAQTLAYCLVHEAAAKAKSGHISSFFGEVKSEHQFEFAHQFGIKDHQLAAAAKAFAAYTGEFYPLAV